MPDPVWPSVFPQRPRVQSQMTSVAEKQRVEMEYPIVVERARSMTPIVRWQVQWQFDNSETPTSQFQAFRAWVARELDGGVNWFTWPAFDGAGFQNTRAKIDGVPTEQMTAGALYVLVTATLMLENPPVITDAALDTYLAG